MVVVFSTTTKEHTAVLMGICDATYRFLYIDVGANGRISDGGVYNKSTFHQALHSNENPLEIPPPCKLPGRNVNVPFVLVGDDAFALDEHLMKPYAHQNLSNIERTYNYRLSRARRTIENVFGILANKFRIFHQPLQLNPQKCRIVTKAACALHNFLIDWNSTSKYMQGGLADSFDENDHYRLGSWRQDTAQDNFYRMQECGQREMTRKIQTMRDELAQYFINEGELGFQYENI